MMAGSIDYIDFFEQIERPIESKRDPAHQSHPFKFSHLEAQFAENSS